MDEVANLETRSKYFCHTYSATKRGEILPNILTLSIVFMNRIPFGTCTRGRAKHLYVKKEKNSPDTGDTVL